jgi:hypothetical protein
MNTMDVAVLAVSFGVALLAIVAIFLSKNNDNHSH